MRYEIDTSEFEKSGGPVRCMTLDIHIINEAFPIETSSVEMA
jgi:hypothetical protein